MFLLPELTIIYSNKFSLSCLNCAIRSSKSVSFSSECDVLELVSPSSFCLTDAPTSSWSLKLHVFEEFPYFSNMTFPLIFKELDCFFQWLDLLVQQAVVVFQCSCSLNCLPWRLLLLVSVKEGVFWGLFLFSLTFCVFQPFLVCSSFLTKLDSQCRYLLDGFHVVSRVVVPMIRP